MEISVITYRLPFSLGTKMVKIFIGNLNEDSDPSKLRGLFEAFGTVTECDILSKYGFVVSI